MKSFNVALLQLAPAHTMEQALTIGLAACTKAKELGANLALFPEMWQIGYQTEFMHNNYAIDTYHDFIQQFCLHARQLKMAIAVTYLGMGIEKPTNNLVIIDSTGEIVLEYAKVHICNFEPDGTERTLEAGNVFRVCTISLPYGDVTLGAMICFDREFPESARILMNQGAEIILVPNSSAFVNDPDIGDIRFQQLRARAFENMVGIALANYAQPKNDGHSCAIDVDGKPLMVADDQEGIFMATFDLDKIRSWQKGQVWGNKYRRVDLY